MTKPKPDKLLTKAEMSAINNAQPLEAKYGEVFEAIAIAQRDLTASIKDAEFTNEKDAIHTAHNKLHQDKVDAVKAECQARIENLIKEIENQMIVKNAIRPYFGGKPKKEQLRLMSIWEEDWIVLKKQAGVK